jgi:hypothetical protein
VDNSLFLYKYVWALSEPSWPFLPSPDLARFFPFISYREFPPSRVVTTVEGSHLPPFTSLRDFRSDPDGAKLSQCMLECTDLEAALTPALIERLRITPLPNHSVLLGVPEFSLKLLQQVSGALARFEYFAHYLYSSLDRHRSLCRLSATIQ